MNRKCDYEDPKVGPGGGWAPPAQAGFRGPGLWPGARGTLPASQTWGFPALWGNWLVSSLALDIIGSGSSISF